MDATHFAYWLQGFVELTGDAVPTKQQWQSIREHLQTVFKKVTPPVYTGGASGTTNVLPWDVVKVTC